VFSQSAGSNNFLLKIVWFWDVALRKSVGGFQRFGRIICNGFQGKIGDLPEFGNTLLFE
jgi:hypothetical protein